MANNAYNALQRLSIQESYVIKKRKKLKELIEQPTVFDDNDFKIVKVNTKVIDMKKLIIKSLFLITSLFILSGCVSIFQRINKLLLGYVF